MPVVEKVSGGEFYHRGLDRRLSQADRADVNADLAAYLCDERGDFERIEDHTDAEFREVDDEEDDDADEGEAEENSGDDGFDVEAFLDRTPVEDVEEDIHAGEVDDHLDAVQEAADRVTVETAVGERRAELAEEE